jgi:hypothetical protein
MRPVWRAGHSGTHAGVARAQQEPGRLVRRVVAAAAVAVATLGLGGGVSLASGAVRPHRGNAARRPTGGATHHRSRLGGLPAFFTDSVFTGDGPWIYQVRDAANARVTSHDNKLYLKSVVTAALAGDRAYVVAVGSGTTCLTQFYLLRVTPEGKPQPLRQQLLPAVHKLVWSLAATPDGKQIAYAASGCSKGSRGYLAVTSVATGRTQRWDSLNLGGVSAGSLQLQGNLSLSADGSVLGFAATTSAQPVHWSFRVLPTSAPPGPVRARSRIVGPRSPSTGINGVSAAVSSDGKTLYTCLRPGGKKEADHLAAYSVATGRRLRGLGTLRGPGDPQGDLAGQFCVLSRDVSGRYLLVAYGISYGGPSADTPTLRVARLDLATGSTTRFRMKLPSAVQAPQLLPTGAVISW